MPSERILTNAFPISFESEECPYRTWSVVGLDDEDDSFEQNRITLRRLIARDVGGPAEIARGAGGRLTVYVPEGCGDPRDAYELVPRVASLRPADPGLLRVGAEDPHSRRLATRFLQSAVDGPLWKDPSLWQPRAGRAFFEKRAANHHDRDRLIDVFEGHNVRVSHIEEVGFVVFIRETVRYVLRDPWPTRIDPSGRKSFLKAERRGHGNPRCVYRFGDQWYEVTVQSVLPDSVSDIQFVDASTGNHVTVYDHTRNRWKALLPEWTEELDPECTAISYRTWAGSERRNGFTQLCHRIVTTEEIRAAGRSGLHRDHAIRAPDVRLKGAAKFARTLGPFEIGGLRGYIQSEPAGVTARSFTMPSLEYGGGHILNPHERLSEYPHDRMALLKRKGAGLWETSPLGEQWALVPSTIKSTLWPPFLKALQAEIRSFSNDAFQYQPTVVWYDDPGPGLARQVRAVHAAIQRRNAKPTGYCLAVLPHRAHPQLAATLTGDLAASPPLHVACVHKDSFRRFFESPSKTEGERRALWSLRRDRRTSGRAKGYFRNVALKLLILNNKWPFVLAENGGVLDRTLYVGLDVLNGTAGFTFMARGGRECFFRSSGAARPEKVSGRLVFGTLTAAFDDARSILGTMPERAVLLRDGRLFPGEMKGFEQACVEAGISRASSVEIPKRSAAGHRLFEVQGRGMRQHITNPKIGTWLRLSDEEALVATTGYPFSLPGSAQPLLVRRRSGDEPIERLAEDVFALTQLAWTAPDRPIRDPFVLRYTDQRLRSVGAEIDREEVLFGPEVS